jgi:hypothetical protein
MEEFEPSGASTPSQPMSGEDALGSEDAIPITLSDLERLTDQETANEISFAALQITLLVAFSLDPDKIEEVVRGLEGTIKEGAEEIETRFPEVFERLPRAQAHPELVRELLGSYVRGLQGYV